MLALLVALFCDLVTPAAPRAAAPAFSLVARATHSRIVEIHGRGLPRSERIAVTVDLATPHASVACAGAFRREVRTDEHGRLDVRIRSRDPDCDFSCDGDRTPLEVVLDFAHAGLAGSGPFPCFGND